MRLNVYTEEMFMIGNENVSVSVSNWIVEDGQPIAEIVTAEYISSRTKEKMTNYGLRIYLKSHPDLHYIPDRDDDRSAVTFWCGPKEKNVFLFLETIREFAQWSTLDIWREKTKRQQAAAEKLLRS